ncbi:hypothetical protein J0798_27350 [Bacillus pacificus]
MVGKFELKRLFYLSENMLLQDIDYQVVNGIRYKNNLEICAIFKYDYKDINTKKSMMKLQIKYIHWAYLKEELENSWNYH